jgi:hypothetical protein
VLRAGGHGDAGAYAHFRERYRDMARTLGFAGHRLGRGDGVMGVVQLLAKVDNDITVAAAMEAAGGSTPIHRFLRRFRSVLVRSRERCSPEGRRRAMEDQLQLAIQICRSRTQTESLLPRPKLFRGRRCVSGR